MGGCGVGGWCVVFEDEKWGKYMYCSFILNHTLTVQMYAWGRGRGRGRRKGRREGPVLVVRPDVLWILGRG